MKPPTWLWRVARRSSELGFSYISPEDAWGNGGNRFDVPGTGVLYAGTTPEACYVETLARFRPSPRILSAVATDGDYMVAGGIPSDWREQRALLRLQIEVGNSQFVDLDHSRTLAHLWADADLARRLNALGASEVDRGTIYSSSRPVTRLVAQWLHAQTDAMGGGLYAGFRYQSRLGKQYYCWAVFENRARISVADRQPIAKADRALLRVAHGWGLTIH